MNKLWLFLFMSVIPLGYLFSQGGHWDDKISFKKEKTPYLVFGENVNIREKPDTSSPVKFMLQPLDKVIILKKTEKLIELNQTKEFWYEVKYQDKTGYIWGGLLSDAHFTLGTKIILVRNLGVKLSQMEIKLFENKKQISYLKWDSGPVDNETEFKLKAMNASLLKDSPEMLFALGYFVFSEIEYGHTQFKVFTLGKDKILKSHFSWSPSGCDPPSCGETTVLMPGDSIGADKKTKRAAHKGIPNGIKLLHHHFDTDDPNVHDYYVNEYLWNGKEFNLKETNQ